MPAPSAVPGADHQRPVLGVLGGMGPFASVDFLAQLHLMQQVETEQQFLAVVLSCDPTVPDRTQALAAGRTDEVVDALRRRALAMRDAGATFLAMPCNTAHAFKEQVFRSVGIPLVDMLAAVAREARERCPDAAEAVVLATEGTMRAGLYEPALANAGFHVRYPSPAGRAELADAIERLKRTGASAGSAGPAVMAIEKVVAERGNHAVPFILGCTELPLVRGFLRPCPAFIDSTRCLAAAALRHARITPAG